MDLEVMLFCHLLLPESRMNFKSQSQHGWRSLQLLRIKRKFESTICITKTPYDQKLQNGPLEKGFLLLLLVVGLPEVEEAVVKKSTKSKTNIFRSDTSCLSSDILWWRRTLWLVNTPPWSWYDVSAGASRGSAQSGGEAEAGGLKKKPDAPESSSADSLQGPDVNAVNVIWRIRYDLKLRTFLSRVCFANEKGKKRVCKYTRLFARTAPHLTSFESVLMPCPCVLCREFVENLGTHTMYVQLLLLFF